jgi:hypothetical protein
MSGLAVFGLKCPSLLDFDKRRLDPTIKQNLHDLYRVSKRKIYPGLLLFHKAI